jgi:hypothetical protein
LIGRHRRRDRAPASIVVDPLVVIVVVESANEA